MVLISIQPFALGKILLIVVALLGFATLCFADPVLMAQRCSSPPSEEGPQLKRVDFPTRGQQSLPWGEDAAESSLSGSEFTFPALVISKRFV